MNEPIISPANLATAVGKLVEWDGAAKQNFADKLIPVSIKTNAEIRNSKREKLPILTEADKTNVGRTVETVQKERDDIFAKRDIDRPTIDNWRKEIAAHLRTKAEQPDYPFSDQEEANYALGVEEVQKWDAAAPKELTKQEEEKNRDLQIVGDKIKQAELVRREQLGIELQELSELLMLPTAQQWPEKMAGLQKLQKNHDNVVALTKRGAVLNKQLADLWREKFGDKAVWDDALEKDAVSIEAKKNKHPMNMAQVDALYVSDSLLTPDQKSERSQLLKNRAKGLIEEFNGTREAGKQLSVIEENRFIRNLGIIVETLDTGETIYKMEPDSVIETLLTSEATLDSASAALKEHLDDVAKGIVDSVESAVEIANLKVTAESMVYMAHDLVIETDNQQAMQEAIQIARDKGMVKQATILNQMYSNSRQNVTDTIRAIKEEIGLISKTIKNPELMKKIGKGALIGVAALLLLSLLIGGGLVSATMGGSGRG